MLSGRIFHFARPAFLAALEGRYGGNPYSLIDNIKTPFQRGSGELELRVLAARLGRAVIIASGNYVQITVRFWDSGCISDTQPYVSVHRKPCHRTNYGLFVTNWFLYRRFYFPPNANKHAVAFCEPEEQ